MPRDKKIIHRATSDVEDELLSDEEPVKEQVNVDNESDKINDSNNLLDERKKFLKDAILKRTLALKQQRERNRQHKVELTQKY